MWQAGSSIEEARKLIANPLSAEAQAADEASEEGAAEIRGNRPGVRSGMGAALLLCGLAAAVWMKCTPARTTGAALESKIEEVVAEASAVQCPGVTTVQGLGQVKLTNNLLTRSGNPASPVEVVGETIQPHLGGRTYFSQWCTAGAFDNDAYVSMPLLGKTIQYTVDLSGAGCGCNVAFYLTSMRQNQNPTECQDYYCDANNVCGERCDEVDIMEANSKVWRSTLHLAADDVGGAAGYGGTGPHTQTWTRKEYGPGARCIDTNKPFEVRAHFPVHDGGVLQGMMVDLTQAGSSCEKGLTATVGWYKFRGEDGIVALSKALKAGMVPIVSYWSSSKLSWLDGQDINGETPCSADIPTMCPQYGPKVYGFQVRNFTGWIHHSTMNLSPKPKKTTAAPAAATAATAATAGVAVATATTAATAAPAAAAATGAAPAAAASLATGAPAGAAANEWVPVKNNGQEYFYNTRTKEASWTVPIAK